MLNICFASIRFSCPWAAPVIALNAPMQPRLSDLVHQYAMHLPVLDAQIAHRDRRAGVVVALAQQFEPHAVVCPLNVGECPSTAGIFWPLAAFSLCCRPQHRLTMPAAATSLGPCQRTKSTTCGRALSEGFSQGMGAVVTLQVEGRRPPLDHLLHGLALKGAGTLAAGKKPVAVGGLCRVQVNPQRLVDGPSC